MPFWRIRDASRRRKLRKWFSLFQTLGSRILKRYTYVHLCIYIYKYIHILIHSLKRTVRNWKLIVGRWNFRESNYYSNNSISCICPLCIQLTLLGWLHHLGSIVSFWDDRLYQDFYLGLGHIQPDFLPKGWAKWNCFFRSPSFFCWTDGLFLGCPNMYGLITGWIPDFPAA